MNTQSHNLSAIVVNYNTRQMTLDCLRTLTERLTGLERAEIFVVDNGSTDGSVETIRLAFPDVKLIENPRNLGFGAANNQAMWQASGEWILLLNSDAFPKSGAVEAMLEVLRRRPQVAVVGPRLLNTDGSLQLSCYRFPSPMRSIYENLLLTAMLPNHPIVGDYRAWRADAERDVDFVIGACMMVRKSAIDQVGLFDESFFLYAEETDWCRRFRDAGWTVTFTPAAHVTHWNGESGKQQAERVFNEFRWAAERYIRKYHGVAGLVVFRLSMMVGAVVRITVFGAGIVIPRQRQRSFRMVKLWGRILKWTIGFRGAESAHA